MTELLIENLALRGLLDVMRVCLAGRHRAGAGASSSRSGDVLVFVGLQYSAIR